MRATIAILAISLFLWESPDSARAQQPGAIRWKAEHEGVIAPAPQMANSSDVLDATQERHVVLQFKKLPDAKEKEKLEAKGVTLLRYLGENSFFAHVKDGKKAKDQANKSGLQAASQVKRNWKLHPRLIRGDVPDYAKFPRALAPGHEPKNKADKKAAAAQEEILALYMIFHADVDLAKTGVAIIGNHGGTVRALLHSINGAVIWLPSGNLQALADEDAVQWIEPPLPPMSTTNDGVRAAIQANLLNAPPYSLDGTGIQVMVYDGGTALASHTDFDGRLFVRDNSDLSDHATHVAGIIGGSGANLNGLYAGMAMGVNIQSFGFEHDGTGAFLYTNPGDLEADYSKAISTYGVVIANNSIGTNLALNGSPCDWEGDYGATDMLIDAIALGSLGSPMRIIWANGNERGVGRCGIEYHTTAPPACAKNHITVGAINSNDDTMTTFSSWGPTDDGRIKPDVCAPGCQVGGDNGITSTIGTGGYGVMCGTSMAAPAVTGVAALLLQDWKSLLPEEPLPRNSLLKVFFTHTAMDLGTTGPDYKFGYGAVRGVDAIQFMHTGNFAQNTIEHGQEQLYFVHVSEPNSPLKVTMAWDDPPGAVNTIPQLVNDLDLKVISPTGVSYYPWTLDPANPSSAAVRTQADHLNNIEQVVVDSAESGTWRIVIRGYSVPSGPQSFSIAASPLLSTCSRAGLVMFSSPKFKCDSNVSATLKDCDLNTNATAIDFATITISSNSEPAGETVTLTETSADSATFQGTVPVSTTDSAGVLLVTAGDTLTAYYLDADNGQGQTNVPVTAAAGVDCDPPVVSKLTITNLTASSADVTFTSSEPCRTTVYYGVSCPPTVLSVSNRQYLTEQAVSLKGLAKNTVYYYTVDVEDEAGNVTTLTNNGACYTFATPDRQDFFTELFSPNGFDLNAKAITFIPAQNLHKYSATIEPITALPINTAGIQNMSIGDDSYQEVVLTDGKRIPFFNKSYASFFIGSNGYVTFDSGDSDFSESVVEHFQMPRISVFFDDLNGSYGSIKCKQFPDRVVVSWEDVPEYSTSNSNTFQLIMRFDGQIQMAWLGMNAVDGLVGLSQGLGVSSEFLESDLSNYPACDNLPEKAFNPAPVDALIGASIVQTLSWRPGWRATSHELFFGPAADQLISQGTLTQTTFQLPVLTNQTAYFWRVDEINASGRTTGDVWTFTTTKLKPDFDSDGDVDMTDFAHLQLCFSGADNPQEDPDCESAHLDADTDVDVNDAALFTNCLSGSNKMASGTCLP